MESIVVDCYGNIASAWSIYHRRSTFIFSRVVLELLFIRLKLAVGNILFRLLFLQSRVWVEWCWWWSLVGIYTMLLKWFTTSCLVIRLFYIWGCDSISWLKFWIILLIGIFGSEFTKLATFPPPFVIRWPSSELKADFIWGKMWSILSWDELS